MLTTIRAQAKNKIEILALVQAGEVAIPKNGDVITCFGGLAVVQESYSFIARDGNKTLHLDVRHLAELSPTFAVLLRKKLYSVVLMREP